ncbi:hypothetical protein [Brevibacillus sp. NRS-1366]|uniref:hypothetical protein n=1 Tax=Brevibacillus sp. NRS-1366 TaxID=3233899 RepID=UPI003D21F643
MGGVDPAGFDGQVDRSLDLMVELAVETNTDIDLHLHDYDSIGLYTMKRLEDITEDAKWQGRVAISDWQSTINGWTSVPFRNTWLRYRWNHPAEIVARRAKRQAVMYKGKVVAGTLAVCEE